MKTNLRLRVVVSDDHLAALQGQGVPADPEWLRAQLERAVQSMLDRGQVTADAKWAPA